MANLGIWRSHQTRSFTKVYPSLIMAVFTLETSDHPSWKKRLRYFGSEYKMAEQSFHSFHEEEIRELLPKNRDSK